MKKEICLLYFLLICISFQNSSLLTEALKRVVGVEKKTVLNAGELEKESSEEDSEEESKKGSKEKEFTDSNGFLAWAYSNGSVLSKALYLTTDSALSCMDFETETPPPKI